MKFNKILVSITSCLVLLMVLTSTISATTPKGFVKIDGSNITKRGDNASITVSLSTTKTIGYFTAYVSWDRSLGTLDSVIEDDNVIATAQPNDGNKAVYQIQHREADLPLSRVTFNFKDVLPVESSATSFGVEVSFPSNGENGVLEFDDVATSDGMTLDQISFVKTDVELVDFSIVDDQGILTDRIVTIYRTGDTGEGLSTTYDLNIMSNGTKLTTAQINALVWKVEGLAGFEKHAYEYVALKDGKLTAKKSGIVRLSTVVEDQDHYLDIVIPGDVSRNGLLNTQDAGVIQSYNAHKKMPQGVISDAYTILLADIRPNNIVNAQDASIIQGMAAKTIKPSN